MIILGIDPGLAIVGWGVVEVRAGRFRPVAFGSVQTKPGVPVEDRLCEIHEGLTTLLDRYHPDAVAVEELFFTSNITTGIVVAEARGVILLAVRQKGVPVYEYTPMQVKSAVVGYGKADKRQVIAMVTSMLGLKAPPKPDDTADALAIAICHGNSDTSALSAYFNRPTAIGGMPKKQEP